MNAILLFSFWLLAAVLDGSLGEKSGESKSSDMAVSREDSLSGRRTNMKKWLNSLISLSPHAENKSNPASVTSQSRTPSNSSDNQSTSTSTPLNPKIPATQSSYIATSKLSSYQPIGLTPMYSHVPIGVYYYPSPLAGSLYGAPISLSSNAQGTYYPWNAYSTYMSLNSPHFPLISSPNALIYPAQHSFHNYGHLDNKAVPRTNSPSFQNKDIPATEQTSRTDPHTNKGADLDKFESLSPSFDSSNLLEPFEENDEEEGKYPNAEENSDLS